MSEIPRYYWDACTWIGLINQEESRFLSCKHIMDQAISGEVEILASTFVLAEVYKTACEDPYASLPEERDEVLNKFFRQEFVIKAMVDEDVALCARKLLRYHAKLIKPQDAIHLATALLNDADELHTFDGANLLCLNGKVDRMNGTNLKICIPPSPSDEFMNKYGLLKIALEKENV